MTIWDRHVLYQPAAFSVLSEVQGDAGEIASLNCVLELIYATA